MIIGFIVLLTVSCLYLLKKGTGIRQWAENFSVIRMIKT
jgi:hypothetical protein